VDLITKTVSTVIPVGALPEGISVSQDGSYVYVTSLEKSLPFPFPSDDCSTIILDYQGGQVTVINTWSNTVESVIPISGEIPFATFPSLNGKKLYVVTTRGSLNVIDLTSNVVEKVIRLGVSQAENAALSPDGQKLFITADSISNDIFVFNTLDGQLHRISLDGTGCRLISQGRMAIDPSGEYLIANAIRGTNWITILISLSKEIIEHEVPGSFSGISFSNDGTKTYLVSAMYPRSSGVVFNMRTLKIEKYLPVGGVAAVLSQDESELFVLRNGGLYRKIIRMGPSYPFQYDISVVNLDQNTVIETPIASDNIWCSFERTLTSSSDGKYLIATNSALNTVTIIQTKIIYAPLNFSSIKEQNRSLSQVEYINVLNWQASNYSISCGRRGGTRG
jgi:DNA-binding beta-propeller fold protein YncE